MDYIACNAMMCFTMHNFTVTIHSAEAEFDSVKESLTISKYYSSAQSKLHYQKCNHHIWLSINLVPYLFSTDKYAHSATSSMRIRGHGRLGLIKYQFVFDSVKVTDSSCLVKACSGANGETVAQQFPSKFKPSLCSSQTQRHQFQGN